MIHEQAYIVACRIRSAEDVKSKFESTMPHNAMHVSAMDKPIVKYISEHAKQRLVQRSDHVKVKKITDAVDKGRKVVQSDSCSRIHALTTYGDAEYYHYQDIVVVIKNETIVTSLSYDPSKWKLSTT